MIDYDYLFSVVTENNNSIIRLIQTETGHVLMKEEGSFVREMPGYVVYKRDNKVGIMKKPMKLILTRILFNDTLRSHLNQHPLINKRLL